MTNETSFAGQPGQPENAGQPGQDCILITGSSGRIGAAFIHRHNQRFKEFAFDREGPPHPPESAEHIINCDVGSDESVRHALDETRRLGGGRIAAVFHLAAFYDFSGKPSPLYDRVTVEGTRRLLRGLQDFEVGLFVFTSTMLVHAPTEPGRLIREDDPLEPAWEYPRSKVETEKVLREERGNIPVLSLRVAGVYDDGCHSIPIARHIQRIHERKLTSYLFPGDPSRGQSFLHMDDLVEAMYLAVRRRAELPAESVVLLGEPDVMSFAELQQALGRLLHGRPWPIVRVPKAFARLGARLQEMAPGAGDPFIRPWMIDHADDHYALDISRAKELLGWTPKRSLRDTLHVMVAALKADPKKWYAENGL